jgi:hypothetical protein
MGSINNLDSREEMRQLQIQENLEAEKTVLIDLVENGFKVNHINEVLRLSKEKYLDVMPILLKWIPLTNNYDIKENIIRSLSTPWVKSPVLVKLLIQELNFLRDNQKVTTSLAWAIGNALSIVARKDDIDDLINIAKDKSYGTSRQMVILWLGKIKRTDVLSLLISLLNDPDVLSQVIIAIGYQKSVYSIHLLVPFLNHENFHVRNYTKQAIARINKAQKRS